MEKIIVASKNPVKINAVKKGFKEMFPNDKFEFIGISVSSDVKEQPNSNNETLKGAKNRAKNAKSNYKDASFWVGIEGGIEKKENEMEAFAWIVIESNKKIGKSKTGTFFLPKKVIELLEKGYELGDADDIVFSNNNSKQKNGCIGILTHNTIDRTDYYTQAVIFALIPFKNSDLY